jgi:predicted dehydrogenase
VAPALRVSLSDASVAGDAARVQGQTTFDTLSHPGSQTKEISMTRIAVLSVAHIHSHGFLTAITQEIEEAVAHVIWDDDPKRGEAYAQEFGVRYEPDLDRVVADEQIDAFLITAENTGHMPLLEKALPVGKPVMCEKPLATTVADARRIRDLLQQHSTPLISGYFQPFAGHHRAVKQAILDGRLGKVTHATFRNAHNAAYGRWFDKPALQWFFDPALSGGGALMDMGTHALHLLRHLCGPAEQVWALTQNVSGIYDSVDDYGLMMIRFRNGVIGRVEAGWCFTGGRGGLEVIGSEASIWRDPDELVLGKPGSAAQPLEPLDPRPDRVRRLVAVANGQLDPAEVEADLAACLDAVVIMSAAYDAAASGQWQAVPQV